MTMISDPTEQAMDPELAAQTVSCVLPDGYPATEAVAHETVPTLLDEQDRYFRRLASTGIIPRSLADTALGFWRSLQAAVPGLPVPAESARAGGPVFMHWRAGRHEVSVEIPADEPLSWLYRDRQTDEFEGDDFAAGAAPPRLIERLLLLTRNLA